MLSYAAICVPHESHTDLGPTIDQPRGNLCATTPTKLPVTMPPRNANEAIGNIAYGLASKVSRWMCQADWTGSKNDGGSW